MNNFFYTIANKALRTIQPYVPGRPIEEIRKKLKLRRVVKLASNELPFLPSPAVRKAVMAELNNINRYPYSGCPALSGILAAGLDVAVGQLVFGNGSDELITLCARSFIAAGADEVIVSHPTFLIYSLQSTLCGAKVITVPMKQYRYDLEAIAERITDRTKIIFIANPDNPTGSYITEAEFKKFMEQVPSRVIIFMDEAYYEFARAQKKDYPDTIGFLARYKNLVITRTFSKAYGLAGLRLGYAVSSEEIAGIFNKMREPFNINRVAEAAAIAALKEKKRMQSSVRYICAEKKRLSAAFTEAGLSFVDSSTNFVLVFLEDAEAFVEYALRKGVIVRSMKGWGISGAFRVTVGERSENTLFISVLQRYTRSAKSSRKKMPA